MVLCSFSLDESLIMRELIFCSLLHVKLNLHERKDSCILIEICEICKRMCGELCSIIVLIRGDEILSSFS